MPQNGPRRPDNDDDAEGAEVTENLGGIQGTPAEQDVATADAEVAIGSPADQPAPDAGEIEWAGQVVKKPRHPAELGSLGFPIQERLRFAPEPFLFTIR